MVTRLRDSRLLPGLDLEAGTLYGIGRNYAAHAEELNNPIPSEPIVFLKPRSSLVLDGGPVRLPAGRGRVDYECEIVVALGRGGRNFTKAEAREAIAGYAVGLDITGRDLQEAAKAKSLPWTLAKGLETFAPVGRFVPASRVPDPQALSIHFEIGGEARQAAPASLMLFPILDLVAWLSSAFLLEPGDLIFTGTPKGVGPLRPGDECHARLLQDQATLTELFTSVEGEG
jgi:2-keto-4-pentenoate hydratase/2-oxohepta-3-ene-1,7-dioic acid hydratase in catechol pathway